MKELCFLAHLAESHSKNLNVSPAIHLDDFIFNFVLNHPHFLQVDDAVEYYFENGFDSAKKLTDLLLNLNYELKSPLRLLEFASGYGCVTRHLPSLMPNVELVSCDIHEQAINFISSKLGQKAVMSHKDPKQFHLAQHYDVVFALSFFSHMPKNTWGEWVKALFHHLKPQGVLIFTTHGLVSNRTQFNDSVQFDSDGFWFMPISEQHDLDCAEYGLTVVTKEFVEKEVLNQTDSSLYFYEEAYWWNHQDLYIIKKN